MLDQIFNILPDNQFFQGGLVLGILGGILAYFRGIPPRMYFLFMRWCTIDLVIRNETRLYFWMQHWISHHDLAKRGTLLQAEVTADQRYDIGSTDEELEGADMGDLLSEYFNARHTRSQQQAKYKILVTIANGVHWFRYRGAWIRMIRTREESNSHGSEDSSFGKPENLTLETMRWNRAKLYALLDEVRLMHEIPPTGRVNVLMAGPQGHWQEVTSQRTKTEETVFLREGQKNELVSRIKKFMADRDKYRKVGTPWRFGMLLSGPPGNGKTSVAKMLANELGFDIAICALSGPGINDSSLKFMLTNLPSGSILLLEDVDALFDKSRISKNAKDSNQLTFSGLLNAFDGVGAPESMIVIMTTNHRDRLDKALIRPGRVDFEMRLENAYTDQALEMFRLFARAYHPTMPDRELDELCDIFESRFVDECCSMAELQNYLQVHADKIREAAEQFTPFARTERQLAESTDG